MKRSRRPRRNGSKWDPIGTLALTSVRLPPNLKVEPEWPDLDLQQLLEIAFRGRLISTRDHILLQQLRGEV